MKMKQPRIWFNREKPPTLYMRFLMYLQEEGIVQFTTKMVFEWYSMNKTGSGHADYSAIYPLILNPLQHQGYIKRAFQGSWTVIQQLETEEVETVETSDEDSEFFDYIDSKLKGKEV